MKSGKRLSKISALHYCKLVFRSLLLLAATILYIVNRVRGSATYFGGVENNPWILAVIWLVFVVEMLLRFFPSNLESMGCQKIFPRNFRPAKNPPPLPHTWKSTVAVAAAWLLLNGVFGFLHIIGVLDGGIMLLISLFYSVCDMICILFFCPFQTWFMKNKCCGSCRIYNWDYAMMFTPLIFVASPYALSLFGLSLLLLIEWEVAYQLKPERFYECANESLACANCPEKLCHHKKQLRAFLQNHWKQIAKAAHLRK